MSTVKTTIATKAFDALDAESPPTWRTKDAEGVERMHVRGYASTFDRVDRHGEIIGKSCWDSVPKDGAGVRFIHGHDSNGQAIGVFRSFEVTDKGLYFEAEILPTALGKDLFIQLEARALDTFSVGFIPKAKREVQAVELRGRGVNVPSSIKDDSNVTEYTDAELLEVSTVLFPSNDGAKIGAKSAEKEEKPKFVKRPKALIARKNAAAVDTGVTWAYDDGEVGFGIVVEVHTGETVTSVDGDEFVEVDGDPVYKIHVYETNNGETYFPSSPAMHVYAYRSQVSPAEFPLAQEQEQEPETAGEKSSLLDDIFNRAGV